MYSMVLPLDAVFGVQHHIETIWREAKKNRLPRTVLFKKIDLQGAGLSQVVHKVKTQLAVTPLVLHYIFEDSGNNISDIVDSVSMTSLDIGNFSLMLRSSPEQMVYTIIRSTTREKICFLNFS